MRPPPDFLHLTSGNNTHLFCITSTGWWAGARERCFIFSLEWPHLPSGVSVNDYLYRNFGSWAWQTLPIPPHLHSHPPEDVIDFDRWGVTNATASRVHSINQRLSVCHVPSLTNFQAWHPVEDLFGRLTNVYMQSDLLAKVTTSMRYWHSRCS